MENRVLEERLHDPLVKEIPAVLSVKHVGQTGTSSHNDSLAHGRAGGGVRLGHGSSA